MSAEEETRALVASPWWQSAPPRQRAQAIAGRSLALPDGTCWVFGAWARWYRWHPGERAWHLCPPPQSPATRRKARSAAQGGMAVGVAEPPPHVVPAGPDFDVTFAKPLPFVGQGFNPDLTARLKSTLEAAAQLPVQDYPHWWGMFGGTVPSPVAAAWGAMLWSASAPVFDSRYDKALIGLWTPYRAKPLPEVDGPRWLTPPPLEALAGLYSERLRAHRPDAATVVLRTMWAVARVLRDDVRFRARSDALVAIIGATLANPQADYAVLPYGDQALVQQWLSRVPPELAPAVRIESSAGDNVRHAFYELTAEVTRVCGDPSEPSYIEPRLVAAALVAADLALVKRHVVDAVVPWFDPEIRYTVLAVLDQAGHPLRRFCPKDGRLPRALRANLGGRAAALLAATYAQDLAWCRLGGIPARPRGFPVPTALISELIGPERASAASAAPITAPPGVGTPAGPPAGFESMPGPSQTPGPGAGAAEQLGAAIGQGAFDVPEPPAGRPEQDRGRQGQAGGHREQAGGQPEQAGGQQEEGAEEEAPAAAWVPPYTMLGFEGREVGAHAVGPDLKAVPFGQDEADVPYQPPTPGPVPEEVQWSPSYTMLGFQQPQQPQQKDEEEKRPATKLFEEPPLPPSRAEDAGAEETVPDGAEKDFDVKATVGDKPPQPASTPSTELRATRRDAPPKTPQGAKETMLDAEPPPAGPAAAAHRPVPPPPNPAQQAVRAAGKPGTQIMSETMVGNLLEFSAGQRPPVPQGPPQGPPFPRIETHGVSFIGSGLPGSDVAALLKHVRRDLTWAKVLFDPNAEPAKGAPNLLLVGEPHSGQHRLARMVALALAEAGVGDGSVRIVDAASVRDPEQLKAALDPDPGPGVVVMVERLDEVIKAAADPGAAVAAIQGVRLESPARTALVAVCTPRGHRRLAALNKELIAGFQVVHLPDLANPAGRLALLNVLADERRLAVDAAAFQAVQRDLTRLLGLGQQTGARLVEQYLDRAAQRHLSRFGVAQGQLVLTAEDFAGVAEQMEPPHRPAEDADVLLHRLDEMLGLQQVKEAMHRLTGVARSGAAGPQHLVLLGRPGTGKSAVAELVGGIYRSLGMLTLGHTVSCRPVHLAGRDAFDTEDRVHGLAEQARGGVLLIEEAHRLAEYPHVVEELGRAMRGQAGRLIVICTSTDDGFEAYLLNNPEFRGMFGEIVRCVELTDRELMQLFQRQAERDLYTLDEELKLELMSRFARMRQDPGFAFGRTVREMFEQSVARQAARLRGAQMSAAAATRLSVRDLPEPVVQQPFRDLRRQ